MPRGSTPISRGYLEEGARGTARDGSWFRYGNGFKYDAKFIEDLAQNWIPVDSLQKRLGAGHAMCFTDGLIVRNGAV